MSDRIRGLVVRIIDRWRITMRSIAGRCAGACARRIMFQGRGAWLLKMPGYLGLLRFFCDLFRLLHDLPGIGAWKVSNENWSVVFAGSRDGLAYFRHKLCQVDDSADYIGTFSLVSIAQRKGKWLAGGVDLVVVETSPLLSRFLRAPCKFIVPTWIEMLLPFAEPLEGMIAGTKKQSLRNVINKYRRNGYRSVYSRRDDDFETFYKHMYHPFVTRKHASLASVITFDLMSRIGKDRGGILFIEKDGVKVAGSLCLVHNHCCYGIIVGILDADEKHYRRGILSFLYWSTIVWGHSQGAVWLNMGQTRPGAAEGVYPYKIKWGAKAIRCRRGVPGFIFLATDFKPSLQDRINRQKLICEQNGKLHSLLVQGSSRKVPAAEIQDRLRQSDSEGLAGVIMATAGEPDSEWDDGERRIDSGLAARGAVSR